MSTQTGASDPVKYGRAAKVGVAWGGVRIGFNELLLIPAAMVLARLLTPADFGIIAAAGLFTGLVDRLTTVGFAQAILRVRELRPDHVSSVFVFSLVKGIVLWMALSVFAPWMGAFFNSPETARVLPVAALAYPLGAFGTIPMALLSRNLRFREGAVIDVASNVIGAVASVAFAWFGFRYWSVVYASLIATALRVLLAVYMASWAPAFRFSVTAFRELAALGLGFQARSLLQWASERVDNLVVGRLLGIPALGLYDKAYSGMTRFVSRVNMAGPTVSLRIFSLIHEERERFRRAYRKVILGITLLGYPVLTGMAVSAPHLFMVMFGPQWVAAVLPFQVLCAAGMMRLLNTYASSATQAKGLVWLEVRRQALYAVLIVVVSAVGSRWGITGVACGVLAATAVMTWQMQSMVRKLAHLEWRDILAPQVPGAVCAAGIAVVVLAAEMLVRSVVPAPAALLVFAVQCAAAGAFYAVFLFASGFPEVRGLVQETLTDFAPGLARRVQPFWPEYVWSSGGAGHQRTM